MCTSGIGEQLKGHVRSKLAEKLVDQLEKEAEMLVLKKNKKISEGMMKIIAAEEQNFNDKITAVMKKYNCMINVSMLCVIVTLKLAMLIPRLGLQESEKNVVFVVYLTKKISILFTKNCNTQNA